MDAQTWMDQFEAVAAACAREGGLPHVAVCFACTPPGPVMLPHDFAGPGPRDAWAAVHARMFGHRVERYDIDQGGALRSLPAARPPRGRLGAAPAAGGGQ